MTAFDFSAPTGDVARIFAEWLDEYIDAPHPDIGRDGQVCPFVAPALRADSLRLVSYLWPEPPALPTMLAFIRVAIRRFIAMPWSSPNSNLHALVVAMPDLPVEGWSLIDEGHEAAKDDAVAGGIMLGQFHPRCAAPAARNPLFPVNRSPFPLFAIRHMALHDILFLHDSAQWFPHYRARFGRRYAAGRIDPHFGALFRIACERTDRVGVDAVV